jgi:hypothetical protein
MELLNDSTNAQPSSHRRSMIPDDCLKHFPKSSNLTIGHRPLLLVDVETTDMENVGMA